MFLSLNVFFAHDGAKLHTLEKAQSWQRGTLIFYALMGHLARHIRALI